MHPIPHIRPLLARIDFHWNPDGAAAVSSLYYVADHNPATFSMFTFGPDWYAAVGEALAKTCICRTDYQSTYFWTFFNWGGVTRSIGMPTSAVFPSKGLPPSFSLCPCAVKRGISGGRNFTGRAWLAAIPSSYLGADGSFTTAANTAYDEAEFYLGKQFTSQGVIFKPVIYSLDLDDYDLIHTFKIIRQPRTKYGRRRRIAPSKVYYIYPTVL